MTLLTEIRYTKFISTKINVLGNRWWEKSTGWNQ
jgi:hypothetical protein